MESGDPRHGADPEPMTPGWWLVLPLIGLIVVLAGVYLFFVWWLHP